MANPFAGLELRAPRLGPEDAAGVARALFGVDGAAHELGSTQDQNFRIDAADDRRRVLKVANAATAPEELALSNRAMEHAAAALPGLVPVPLRTPDGLDVAEVEVEGARHRVRLLTYLEGEPLRGFGHLAPEVLGAVGGLAGRVAAALASFDHPAADRVLQWDVRRAADAVAAFASRVRDPRRRALAERVVERATAALDGLRPGLRLQVVHGDVTGWNVLARPDAAGRPAPCGLVDFGDATRSWLAAECAVLVATVATRSPGRTLQDAVRLVAGFHAATPLTEDEVAALPALVAARGALSAVCGEHQGALEPENAYAAAGVEDGWRRLAAVAAVPLPLAHAAFREACGLPPLASRRAGPRRGAEPAAPDVVGVDGHRGSGPAAPAGGRREAEPAAPGAPGSQERRAEAGPGVRRRAAEAAAPVVDGLDGRTAVPVDLSVRTDALRFGAWRDPVQVAAAVERAAASVPGGIAVGRHGEARIVPDDGPAPDEPATVHLGVDLFVPEGTAVRAPLAGRVVAREERGLVLAPGDGLVLRLAGLVPARAEGDRVGRGEDVGRVAPPPAGDPLPAHLHAQLATAQLAAAGELPGLVPASLAGAWLALCPDPGPLLGLDVGVPAPDPPAAVLARRRRFVASPQLLYYPADPPQFERGWRQWLYDASGRCHLDVINNVAVVGHAHPRVEAAAARQLRLLNTNSRFLYDAMGRFAERLVGLVPAPLEVVFLVNSGSEANDLALRLAREVTGRQDVLCFEATYHGWTTATIETERARLVGTHDRGADRRVHPVLRPVGDTLAPARSLAHLEEVVGRLVADGRPPAAFVCEPLLGNEGGVVLSPGYLRRAYGAVRSAGGLCVADEVQVGYGRSGAHFWAFEQQGVVPDVVTLGKATGNGHPVAAVITTRAVADAFGRRDDFFSSVGGSPVSCEVGLAVLDVLEEERLQENARAVGDYLAERLAPLAAEHPLVGALHGTGLYRGLELVREGAGGGPPAPARAEALAVCERMRALGVVVQPTGPSGNVLKLKPPLCVTREDVDVFAAALRRTLADGW